MMMYAMDYDILVQFLEKEKAFLPNASFTSPAKEEKKPYKVIDETAYIDLKGVMTKESRYSWWEGKYTAGTTEIRQMLRLASKDDAVKKIALCIDSPGGEVNGAFELASDVAVIKKKKPIHAFGEGSICSAAYLVASQCSSIACTDVSKIGSVGVYTVLADTSKMYEDNGVQMHIVRSGAAKGIGEEGIPIDAKDLKRCQKMVDGLYAQFISYIKKNRDWQGGDEGDVYLASEALDKKLVDRVCTIDQFHKGVLKMSADLLQTGDTEDDFNSVITDVEPVATAPVTLSDFIASRGFSEQDVMARLEQYDNILAFERDRTIRMAVATLGAEMAQGLESIVMGLNYDQLMTMQKQYKHQRQMQQSATAPAQRQTVTTQPRQLAVNRRDFEM